MAQNSHEGWRGFRIDQLEPKARLSVPKYQPNLITLNVGSNDCRQCYDIATAGERIERLLRCIWEDAPDAMVLLSTLIVNADEAVEDRVVRVNEQFANVARTAEKSGKRCVLVDMHCAEGPRAGELVDGTHPNDQGYEKMARIWCDAICNADAKGMIS
jgi:lysophospholipase L1-like esterase